MRALRLFEVFGGCGRIAAGVVMAENKGGSIRQNHCLHDFARMRERATQIAHTDDVDADDAIFAVEEHYDEVFAVGIRQIRAENFGGVGSGANLWTLELGEGTFSDE